MFRSAKKKKNTLTRSLHFSHNFQEQLMEKSISHLKLVSIRANICYLLTISGSVYPPKNIMLSTSTHKSCSSNFKQWVQRKDSGNGLQYNKVRHSSYISCINSLCYFTGTVTYIFPSLHNALQMFAITEYLC